MILHSEKRNNVLLVFFKLEFSRLSKQLKILDSKKINIIMQIESNRKILSSLNESLEEVRQRNRNISFFDGSELRTIDNWQNKALELIGHTNDRFIKLTNEYERLLKLVIPIKEKINQVERKIAIIKMEIKSNTLSKNLLLDCDLELA